MANPACTHYACGKVFVVVAANIGLADPYLFVHLGRIGTGLRPRDLRHVTNTDPEQLIDVSPSVAKKGVSGASAVVIASATRGALPQKAAATPLQRGKHAIAGLPPSNSVERPCQNLDCTH